MSRALGCWFKSTLRSGEVGTDQGLTNRFTGERIRKGGHFELPGRRLGQKWLRLDYLHDDLEFPVLACWQPEDGQIVLDYEASAALWRQETNSDLAHPPYGAWVRVDDCVIDAIWCWPEILETLRWQSEEGPSGGWIGRVGGWCNGAWRPEFSRVDVMLPDSPSFRSLTFGPAIPVPSSRPTPLDQQAPSPWFYIDATSYEAHDKQGYTSWEGECLYREYEASGERYHYEERDSVTINGVVPHMRSQDGDRILYPWESHIYEGYPNDSTIDFAYRTEDHGWEEAVFSRSGRYWNPGVGLEVIWPSFSLGGSPTLGSGLIEEIHFVETRNQMIARSRPGIFRLLSQGARRRVARDLVDAFLSWEGTDRTPEAWGEIRGGTYPGYERPEFLVEQYRIVGGEYRPVLTFSTLSLPEEFKRLGFDLDRFVDRSFIYSR